MQIKKLNMTVKMPKKYDIFIHLAVLVLIVFGTLMIISTNVGNSQSPLSLLVAFVKQLVFVIISYLLLTFFANNFTMKRARQLCFFIGIFLCIALLSTQFFEAVYGSKAWIRISLGITEVTLQPSEFAKVFMVVVMAVYVEMFARRNFHWKLIMRIPLLFFVAFLILIGIQPDLGAMVVITLMTVACFLISSHPNMRTPQRVLIGFLLVGVVFGSFLMTDAGIEIVKKLPSAIGHVATRFETAADPFENPYGGGYQLINGLYGFARGGIGGVGLGESIQKYGYLTQSDNDFILSIVVEELGIFGLGIVVVGYGVIIYRLFYYALRSTSEGFKIILVGTAMYIFTHFMLNVGGVSGLIPLTGVPLLFISSGGSSLMSIMTAIGISQAVISRIRRQEALQRKQKRLRKPSI